MTGYKKLQARARALGIDTVMDRNCKPVGYWLADGQGEAVWEDGNFAGSLNELKELVDRYEAELSL